MKDGDLSADSLKGVLDDDPGPETVRDAIVAAMAETGGEDEPSPFGDPAPKDEPAADAAADAEDAPTDPPAEAADDGKADDEPEPLDPPADWSAAEHEAFRALTPEGQKFVLDKARSFQSDYTKKTEEVARERDRFSALEKVIGPRAEAWKINGWNEAQAVERLLALSDFATQRPADFVAWFAKENGVDIGSLAPKAPAPEDEEYVDPAVKQLREQLAATQAQIAELSGGAKTREQQEAEAAKQQREQVLRTFETATDEKGAPKHPYFAQVRPAMGALMQAGVAADLESAYAMAVKAHPDVSAKIAAAEKAVRERVEAENKRKQAEKARRAGSSITGSPAGSTAPQPKATVREELMAQFAAAGMRV